MRSKRARLKIMLKRVGALSRPELICCQATHPTLARSRTIPWHAAYGRTLLSSRLDTRSGVSDIVFRISAKNLRANQP